MDFEGAEAVRINGLVSGLLGFHNELGTASSEQGNGQGIGEIWADGLQKRKRP